MSNRYLTHLSTVVFLHLLVLIGSFQIIQEQKVTRPLSIGPAVMKLSVVTQAIFQRAMAPQVASTSTPVLPKKVESKPKVKAETQPEVAESAVEPATSGISTLTGAVNAINDQKALFKAELRAEIEKNKSYPPMARRLGQTGTVVVAFTLLEDGHIIDVKLDSPSPFERLNESALEAVKSIHKFRPIPKEWGQAKMDFTLPVNFLTI